MAGTVSSEPVLPGPDGILDDDPATPLVDESADNTQGRGGVPRHVSRGEAGAAQGGECLLLSMALTSFLTGVTEPVEFTFMFLAPVLYLVHALLTGAAHVIMDLLNVKLGFTFSPPPQSAASRLPTPPQAEEQRMSQAPGKKRWRSACSRLWAAHRTFAASRPARRACASRSPAPNLSARPTSATCGSAASCARRKRRSTS